MSLTRTTDLEDAAQRHLPMTYGTGTGWTRGADPYEGAGAGVDEGTHEVRTT